MVRLTSQVARSLEQTPARHRRHRLTTTLSPTAQVVETVGPGRDGRRPRGRRPIGDDGYLGPRKLFAERSPARRLLCLGWVVAATVCGRPVPSSSAGTRGHASRTVGRRGGARGRSRARPASTRSGRRSRGTSRAHPLARRRCPAVERGYRSPWSRSLRDRIVTGGAPTSASRSLAQPVHQPSISLENEGGPRSACEFPSRARRSKWRRVASSCRHGRSGDDRLPDVGPGSHARYAVQRSRGERMVGSPSTLKARKRRGLPPTVAVHPVTDRITSLGEIVADASATTRSPAHSGWSRWGLPERKRRGWVAAAHERAVAPNAMPRHARRIGRLCHGRRRFVAATTLLGDRHSRYPGALTPAFG